MLKALSEVAPTSAIIAVILWAGIAYFITAPEISTRIAQADFKASCEQAVASTAQRTAQEVIQNSGGSIAQSDQAVQGMAQMNDLLNNSYGDFARQYGTNPFDALTGGALSRTQRQLESNARAQRERVASMAQQARDTILASAPSQCSCQAKLAFLENRTDWALFTGTFGLIEPETVADFGGSMAMQRTTCLQRVMQNG